jgi:hypothetical protein
VISGPHTPAPLDLPGAPALSLCASSRTALFALVPAALVPVVYSLVLYKRLEREGKLEPPAPAPEGPSREVPAG